MDDQIIFEKYLLSVYRFLNYRLRSEKEIRDNLKKKKAPEYIVEKIVETLRDQKFLNDETFAKMWIDSRSRVKPRSHFVLKMELQRKGISKEIIEKIMTNEELPMANELDMARKLVSQKFRKYQGMEKQEIYQKLGGVLGRKGFNWGVTKKAIDEALAGIDGDLPEDV